jgi:hypothetical protein
MTALERVPRAERVKINREFDSVQAFIDEYVVNISRSGVFIRSKDPLPVGTRVQLRFTVIMDELEIIEGIGEVVRMSARPRGMGVVFIELTGYSQDLIAKLITQQSRRAQPRSLPAARRAGDSTTGTRRRPRRTQ